ncbi:DUF5979 domain-containing protein [Glycomyces paridis]|uniref:DUF5979 domain-containing protein n=1 Tax=Glycomyces paridis TaxID=2126555 RepID=UPI0013050E9A|nr:DUF5979 domain-containing protein [Glycomyces paridis]
MLVTVALVMMMSVLSPAPVYAQEPATLSVQKTASVETVQPGETFTYTITVGCTTFGAGCANAVVTDAIPAEFIVQGTPTVSGAAADASADGQNITVTFTEELSSPPGAVGMLPATTAQIQVLVRADPDLPHSADGIPVTNTAEFAGDDATTVEDSVDVTPQVPLDLAVEAGKSFDPTEAVARPGTPTTATITAADQSNGDVEQLVLTDPTDPSASPNPFDHLAVTGFGAVTFPEGADQVQVDVWVDGAWVPGTPGATAVLPAGVDPDDVRGVRLTFTNAAGDPIPAGGSASVELDLVHRDDVSDIDAQTVVNNTVTAEVAAEGDTASDEASADYTIIPLDITAAAGKSFDPDPVAAGAPSTVTLTGTNAGTPVDTMTITEPDPSTDNPFENGLTFTGFTDGVVWPSGATAATVTYTYDDGTSDTLDATGPDTLPAPADGATVTGFTVVFTGDIASGAQATIPFTVDTDPDQTEEEVVHDNQVLVEVAEGDDTGTATASDTLTTLAARLAVDMEKRISPTEINSVPGEKVVVQLPAQIEDFPASTTDATHLIVQDPSTVPPDPDPDPFWNSFDATAITQTAVPAGATLTISYWDGTEWVVLPGAEAIEGAAIVNLPIPADLDVQGLKFDYHDPDGFAPGTSVQPNFQAALRDQKRDGTGDATGFDTLVTDCASSNASVGDVADASDPACADVQINKVPTDGTGDLIEKNFLEPTPGSGNTVIARSGDQIDAELHWSTGGYSGLDQVILSDVADPTIPIDDSFYNAFDLVSIDAITAADDPWLTYDAVARVELWNGTAWVRAASDPCPGACDGTFPGYTLSDTERATTESVRLVFIESPTRADRIGTDPTLPQVGDGVTRSSGDDRTLRLTFQVRDEVRDPQTDPDPVLGSRDYNAGSPGLVNDTAGATGYKDGTEVVRDTDTDGVLIVDVPLNVGISKDWTGGPLGIPPTGTDPDAYPSGRVSITATNRTAANVDSLTITDPLNDDPFDVFDLKQIVSISIPEGATGTTVTITTAAGTTDYSVEDALALTEADLADAVGITVAHTGRIEAGATSTVELDLRLRATHRDGGAAVTTADSPVANDAQAEVRDLGGTDEDTPTAVDDDTITLAGIDISVTAGKSFDPTSITEPSHGPVTMTITGQPGGSTRTNLMTLTDDEPLLWNQYDFSGFGDFSFTAPIDRVQVDAFTGGTFTDTGSGVTVTGGAWTNGQPATSLALPDGVNAADVQGLRFTFTREDGAIWENPATPLQAVPIELVRRDELRTGGPVLTDLTGNAPAPGETAAGVATNNVDVIVKGAVIVDGEPVSATDTAQATVLYRHSKNAVEIVKLADGAVDGGAKPPSTVYPYTIQVTNTGDRAIVDPVIRDVMPTDATGAQLTFDPQANPGGEGAFTYALDGAAPDPASGPAMPTDAAEVTTDITGDVEEIDFSFPAGTVLEVGQVYTITIQLMVRPGVAGGTVVQNTAGVTGDRPWDECDGTLDAATGECQAASSVTVASSASIRSVKSVRAEDDELGELSVDADTPAEECAPNGDGFFVSPCVPILKPGGDHVWRFEATNTGNLGLKEVVGFDQLPTPGDTGAINDNPRGSEWRPLFEGTARLTTAVPDGTVTRLYWTADATQCTQVAVEDCPDGSWTLFPQSGGPAFTDEILESVTALRYEATFPDESLFEPLSKIGFEFIMTAPAFSPAEGPDTIAWNSASVGGETASATEQFSQLPLTEGQRVGVALATGHLAITKEVAGDGAAYAPDSFTLHLECRSAIGTRVEADVPLGDKATQTVTAGETVVVEDLPYGAECTVTEDDANGATDFEATTVTVVRDDEDPLLITATNTYALAGLTVSKDLDSAAVDQDGEPIPYGPFTIEVECTYLGEAVYADGYGPDDPMTAELDGGEEVVFTGLPAGAECTVTETDDKGADGITVTTDRAGEDPVVVDGGSASIVLKQNGDDLPTNTADLTNTFGTGSLVLRKHVFGSGTGPVTPGPFTIQVLCTLDDESGTRTVWQGEVVLGGTSPMEAEIDDLPEGAACSAMETGTGGATFAIVLPRQVTVDSDAPVTLHAVNVLSSGSLEVVKEVTGDGADLYGAGPFEVTLDCVFDTGEGTVTVPVPDGATREFGVDEPAVYEGLPTGSVCTATETGTGGATEVTVSAETATIPFRDQAELTVTNRFDTGGLTVAKDLAGTGADDHDGDDFEFTLACVADVDGETVAVDVPGGATRTVTGAGQAAYTDLPAGAECTLTETGDGGAETTAILIDGADTAEFTVAACDEATCQDAVITNTWTADEPGLTVTGADTADLAKAAAALLLLGLGMIVLARRRRAGTEPRG